MNILNKLNKLKVSLRSFAAGAAALFMGATAPVVQAAAYDSAALVTAVNAEYTGAANGLDGIAILFLGLVAAATIIVLFAGWIKKGRTAK